MNQTKSWYALSKTDKNAEVFIYDEIGGWGITASDFAKEFRALGKLDNIDLRVNCPGGSVPDGMAIYNLLKQTDAKVTTYIDGIALSMGSVIAMAGDKVVMPDNAIMMVHEPWSLAMGNSTDMRKEAEVLDRFGDALVSVYMNKTGLAEEDITALMRDETWMDAAEAQGWGFVDEISGSLKAAACVPYKWAAKYNSIPVDYIAKADEPAVIEKVLPVNETINQTQSDLPDDNKGAFKMAEVKPVGANTDDINTAEIEAQGATKERQRVAGIQAAFSDLNINGQFQHLVNNAINDGDTLAEVEKRVAFLKVAGVGSESGAKDVRVSVVADGRDKFRAGVTNSIQARAGLVARDEQNEFNGYTMLELARSSLIQAGARIPSSKMGVVGAAFTHSTSDFTSLLMDAANKSMLRGFAEAEETFQQWTVKGSLSDFKASNRVGSTDFASLLEVPEGSEYKHTTMSDFGETIQLLTYGALFSITRQAILNDDLAAFTRIPQRLGRAARRTVGDIAYAALTGNPTMGDGVAVFHADHSNLNASGTAITTESVDAVRKAMMLNKGRSSTVTALNIRPKYLLCPVAISGRAMEVQTSTTPVSAVNTKQSGGVSNIVANTFETITDARLDAADANDWYMVADSSMYDTVEVSYLDGNENPFLEQETGFTIDGSSFKVRIDAAAAPMEYASMYKQAGA